jgi:hypothetical protein
MQDKFFHKAHNVTILSADNSMSLVRIFVPCSAILFRQQLEFVSGMYLKLRREQPDASRESVLDSLCSMFNSRYTARGIRVRLLGRHVRRLESEPRMGVDEVQAYIRVLIRKVLSTRFLSSRCNISLEHSTPY